MGAGRMLRLVAGIARIAVFDIGGPLVTYSMMRSAGHSTVTSLVVSGAFPALGVVIGIIANRRADAIGILVLAGIALGSVLGLVTGNAKLVLLEGSVPTAAFGLICLGSLLARRPLMFRFALELVGASSERGREFESLWQYAEFRRAFRNLTAVWGVGYLLEAVARVFLVEHASAGFSLTVSKTMPLAVTLTLAAWTVVYSVYQQRKGARLASAAREHGWAQGAARTRPARPPGTPHAPEVSRSPAHWLRSAASAEVRRTARLTD